MRSTFKILFYIDKNAVKTDGTTAIKCRLSVDGKKSVMSTGLFCRPEDWNPKNECKGLLQLRENIEQKYTAILKSSGIVTAELLKNSLTCVNSTPDNILVAGERERERLRLRSIEIKSESTYRDSKQTQLALLEFIELRGSKELYFKDITHEFGESFKLHLSSTKGYKPRHVNRCMSWLNRLIYTAINQNILKVNPIDDVKYLKDPRPERRHLTRDEIQRIMDCPMDTVKGEFTRRMFIFTAFTSLAYVDIQNLYPRHICQTSEGEEYIRINRKKTDIESFIPLHPIAKQIIDQYNMSDDTQPIFPQMHRNHTWREIVEIGFAAKIKGRFTYYDSRHSFATMMLDEGISIESVSRMMGHVDISSTQVYAKITDEKISADMDRLMVRRQQIANN